MKPVIPENVCISKKAPLVGAFLMACFLLWCVPFDRDFMGGAVLPAVGTHRARR